MPIDLVHSDTINESYLIPPSYYHIYQSWKFRLSQVSISGGGESKYILIDLTTATAKQFPRSQSQLSCRCSFSSIRDRECKLCELAPAEGASHLSLLIHRSRQIQIDNNFKLWLCRRLRRHLLARKFLTTGEWTSATICIRIYIHTIPIGS